MGKSLARLQTVITEFCLAFAMLSTSKSYMAPFPRVHISDYGNYALQFTPPKNDPNPRQRHDSLLCLYCLDLDGHEVILWRSHLNYVPSRFVISSDGHVAATGTYPEVGDNRVVVLFDDRGRVIADYTSQDLLSKEELASTPMDVWGRAQLDYRR